MAGIGANRKPTTSQPSFRSAPIPVVRCGSRQGVRSTLKSHSWPHQRMVGSAGKRTFAPNFRIPLTAIIQTSAVPGSRTGDRSVFPTHGCRCGERVALPLIFSYLPVPPVYSNVPLLNRDGNALLQAPNGLWLSCSPEPVPSPIPYLILALNGSSTDLLNSKKVVSYNAGYSTPRRATKIEIRTSLTSVCQRMSRFVFGYSVNLKSFPKVNIFTHFSPATCLCFKTLTQFAVPTYPQSLVGRFLSFRRFGYRASGSPSRA
jgi:hypothetical protein